MLRVNNNEPTGKKLQQLYACANQGGTMLKLKGSRTAENLLKSFAGESQARNRYEYYAKVAYKEGYRQIQEYLLETAANEFQHAKEFYKHLIAGMNGEMLSIREAGYPVALFEKTSDNLKAAADGEHEEWTLLYPEFAKVAEEEGFAEIARTFKLVSRVEENHERRFLALRENVLNGSVFKREQPAKWICSVCGHTVESKSAPAECPLCRHPQAHFKLLAIDY